MKKSFFLLPFLSAAFLVGCGEQPGTENPIESISLDPVTKLIEVGESFEIKASVEPEDTTESLVWKSKNEDVAKYADGVVTGTGEGKTKILVSNQDGTISASCSVEVYKEGELIHVESVTLDKEEVELEIGKNIKVSCTVLPENATNKSVKWISDDNSIASVSKGTITGVAAGTTTVYAISDDRNISASCEVTVSEQVTPPTPDPDLTKTETLSAKDFKTEEAPLSKTIEFITFNFTQEEGTYKPGYYDGKGGSFKVYQGNKMTISSAKGNISKIEFTYNVDKNTSAMKFSADSGVVSEDLSTWTGDAKTVTFQTENIAGSKAFSTIAVTFGVSAHHAAVDLGVMSIKDVKEYITNAVKDDVFDVNAYGMGVDLYTTVTIKGLAMAKIGLAKTTSKYGYNITEPNKIIIGDDTDAIAVASKTGDGTLYGKVSSYQNKSTSKYSVTGYISMNLGIPELICTEYTWDQNQTETANLDNITKASISLAEFYEKAKAVNYNVAGYGYGDVYTLEGLTCYYSEADGQGKTWYNFTDGTQNIRVNAYNVDRISVGYTYDVVGMISLASYSPIIVGLKFKKSAENPVDLQEFYKTAQEMSIANLKKINYVNNDDGTKYPEMINNYSKIYKTTGYITTVQEGGKYYLGICDTFVATKDFPTGKAASSVNYNLALIKNDNFWNLDDPYFKYNPYIDETDTETPVTVYYTPRQSGFSNGKMYWEILLIPQSIPALVQH